jgi:hypothetical protein
MNPYTLPSPTPRIVAHEFADHVGADLLLGELVAWLPSATLNQFLADFACHLEAGDFADLLP